MKKELKSFISIVLFLFVLNNNLSMQASNEEEEFIKEIKNECNLWENNPDWPCSDLEIMELILAQTDINANCENDNAVLMDVVDEICNTILMDLAKEGHFKIVQFLINNKFDVNVQDKNGQTALMLALQEGHVEVAKLLIDNKADINVQDKNGQTALMIAALKGYVEVAQLLIDNKADINVQDKDGQTALMLALQEGHVEIAKLLTDNKADMLMYKIKMAKTALISQAEKNHIVEIFL